MILCKAIGQFDEYTDKNSLNLGSWRSITALAVEVRILVDNTQEIAAKYTGKYNMVKTVVEEYIEAACLPEDEDVAGKTALLNLLATKSVPEKSLPGANPYERKWGSLAKETTEEMIESLGGHYKIYLTRIGFPAALCRNLVGMVVQRMVSGYISQFCQLRVPRLLWSFEGLLIFVGSSNNKKTFQ